MLLQTISLCSSSAGCKRQHPWPSPHTAVLLHFMSRTCEKKYWHNIHAQPVLSARHLYFNQILHQYKDISKSASICSKVPGCAPICFKPLQHCTPAHPLSKPCMARQGCPGLQPFAACLMGMRVNCFTLEQLLQYPNGVAGERACRSIFCLHGI